MRPLPAILTLVTFMLVLLPACRAGQQTAIPSEEIAVSIDPAAHLLGVRATFALAPSFRNLALRLTDRATEISVAVGEKPVPFTFAGGTLTVSIPATSGDTGRKLAVSYRARFDDPLPQGVVATEDPTYGVTAYIGEEGIYLGADSGWYPEPQARVEDRTVVVRVPTGYEAITAGECLSRKREPLAAVSTWKSPPGAEALSLSAGRFIVNERQMGGVTLATYFSPANAQLSGRYLDAVERYLKFYQDLLGPYPFKQFAVVENFLPTGYGFPSYTLIGSTVIRLPFIVDTSLPHEIAHCWWGNGVRVDYRSGNWCEGLATYLADYLLEEKKSSREGREYRQRILTDYAALVPADHDFPVRKFAGRVDPASRSIGYGKSAMIFHMIRTRIGDRAFFAALREVFRTHLFREAAWGDFMAAFSASSATDLGSFATQWLDRSAGPRLALRNVAVVRDGTGWLVRGNIEQTPPLYELSVPLALEFPGGEGRERQVVTVKGTSTSFSLAATTRPVRLRLDPDSTLFRLLSPGEIPPTVNRVKGARDLLVVVTPGCAATHDIISQLLESLGQGGASRVREEDVSAGGGDRDLLVCGMPKRHDLLPDTQQVVFGDHRFSVEGEAFSSEGDALFLVGMQHGHPGRVSGLFLPLSTQAAALSMPKITHYGKYSYLAFSRGQNRKKGMLPPEGGEGVVTFAGVAP